MIINGKKLPDFLIIGAAKSGTTSLYNYLKQHPRIFFADQKECFFFSYMNKEPKYNSPSNPKGIISNINVFVNQFQKSKTSQLIGDASTSYLYLHEQTINNLKKIYGNKINQLKIIVILRNPIDAAFSMFSMMKRNGNEDISFEEAISNKTLATRKNNNWNYYYNYLELFNYSNQIKAYTKTFKNVKILFFDDLVSNEKKTIEEIQSYLSIPIVKINTTTKHNVSGKPKIKWLYAFLKKDNVPKTVCKRILNLIFSDSYLTTINNKITNKNLSKEKLKIETRIKLGNYYSKEIKKLKKNGLNIPENWETTKMAKTKKIGILTFHREINEGAFLQLYSLSNLLKKTFPNDIVEIIDYRPLRLEYQNIRRTLKRKFPFIDLSDWKKRFYQRKELKKIRHSKSHILTNSFQKGIKFINKQKYDLIVVGSDEVWSIRDGLVGKPPNIFWLSSKINSKKISFAASANNTEIKTFNENIETLKKQLKSFDFITVRDDLTKKLVTKDLKINKNIVTKIPDPTFYLELPLSNVNNKINFPKNKKIIGVSIGDPKTCKKVCCELKKQNNFIVSILNNNKFCDISLKGKIDFYEWADVFRDFNFVVTDRFHGSVFSLKNLTAFLVILENKKGIATNKTLNLLKEFQIDNNYINYDSNLSNIELKKKITKKIFEIEKTFSKTKINRVLIQNKQNLLDIGMKIKSIIGNE